MKWSDMKINHPLHVPAFSFQKHSQRLAVLFSEILKALTCLTHTEGLQQPFMWLFIAEWKTSWVYMRWTTWCMPVTLLSPYSYLSLDPWLAVINYNHSQSVNRFTHYIYTRKDAIAKVRVENLYMECERVLKLFHVESSIHGEQTTVCYEAVPFRSRLSFSDTLHPVPVGSNRRSVSCCTCCKPVWPISLSTIVRGSVMTL